MAVVLAQITLGASATQLSATGLRCRQLIIQNNSTHSMRFGDSTVSATKGILLASGSPGGSINSGPAVVYHTDLFDWWVFGTAADVVDVLFVS